MENFKDYLNLEGKEHSWKSEGHYTKDGEEWTGPQHAHNGQVMTGEKHTADSQNLYHYKELSKEAQDKVEKKHEKVDEACWSGYKQIGMKKKGKKMVPNCVPESFRTRNRVTESTPKSSDYWKL